jgi:hypothetical protein
MICRPPAFRIRSLRSVLSQGTIFLLIGLSGCASAHQGGEKAKKPLLATNAVPPSAAGLSTADISQGARIHIAKCARCHKFYDPAAYSDAEWRLWMTKMSKKAKLTPDQEAVLSRYLEAFRAPRP